MRSSSPAQQKRQLTPKQRVLKRYPNALLFEYPNKVRVYYHDGKVWKLIGEAGRKAWAQAWRRAARKL